MAAGSDAAQLLLVRSLDDLPADLLSLLLGRLGMRRMLLAAAVSRSWRDIAAAKLAEWAALTPICSVGSAWKDAVRPSQSSSWYTRPLGDAPGELRWPCFLTTVPAGVVGSGTHTGDVIVSEHGNGRISVFEPERLKHRCCLGSEGGPLGGRFCRPTGVAVSPQDGSLLVADCGSGRIVRLGLDADAPATRPGASRLEQPCGDVRNVKQPYGLAIASDGRTLFFADSRLHRIVEVDGSGALVRSWGRYGAAPGELDHPRGLTIHGNELIVADRGNNRLQVFDVSHAAHPSASRSRADGVPVAEGGLLPHPVNTLLPVVILAPSRVIGGEGRGPGRFCGPYDTAVARSRLVVSEFEGRRLQVLTLSGAPLQILSLPGNGAPTGITASADGASVFVAQFDLHQLHRLSMRTASPPEDIDVGLAAAADDVEACGERRFLMGAGSLSPCASA